jgi:hypothetical protein
MDTLESKDLKLLLYRYNYMVLINMNLRVAYFIGALQSDGTFHLFKDKKRKRKVYRIRFQVGEKSLPMLKYLQQIFAIDFDRKLKINFDGVNDYGTKIYTLGTSVNELLPQLSALGVHKYKIAKEIATNKRLFCTYLAGLIDGDGDICIKRPKYPQCEIRITAGKPMYKVKQLISHFLDCGVRIEKIEGNSIIEGRLVHSTGCRHCFYLSSKNFYDFIRYVYPHIQIDHKRKVLQKFFKIKRDVLPHGPL